METPKITPKPLVNSDTINKARDVSGLRKWSRESRLMGRMMLILGWFTIPAEVILRRKFGYRWFTPMSFYVGLILLVVLDYLEYGMVYIRRWIANLDAIWNPFYSTEAMPNYDALKFLNNCACLYFVLGIFQLIMRWWRSRTNVELHSYDDGISRLEIPGRILMELFNAMADPVVSLFFHFSRASKKGGLKEPPELIGDRFAFTNTVIEPAAILVAAYYCPGTIPTAWLVITALSVAIYANMKETAKRTRVLDFKDSMLEAKAMAALRSGMQTTEKKPSSTAKKEKLKPIQSKALSYPDLKVIIEEMNREKHVLLPPPWPSE